MNKTKVYLASPYSIGDPEANVKAQIVAADDLLSAGFIPFTPLLYHYHHLLCPRKYEEWLALDFEWIKSCDVLVRLPGESKGADLEVAFAKGAGIPVCYGLEGFYASPHAQPTIQRKNWENARGKNV